MPIRPRRDGYQIDVFVKGCKRIRHQCDGSKRDAEVLEMEIRTSLMKTGTWSATPSTTSDSDSDSDSDSARARTETPRKGGNTRPTIRDALKRGNAAWGQRSEKYRSSAERIVLEALEILEVPDLGLDDLGHDELGKIVAAYHKAGLAKGTIEFKLAVLRSLYTSARQHPALTTYRPDFVPWIPKGKTRADRVLTDKEEAELFAWCEAVGLREFADLCRLALDQALHASEVSRLTVQCFEGLDTSNPTMHVPGTKTAHRAAPLPMTKRAVAAVRRRLGEMERGRKHLFPTYHGHYFRIDAHWAKFREHMGMEEDHCFTFKILRHTCGTRLAEMDANAFSIRDFMRHASVSMSERYVHTARGRLKKLSEGLENRSV